MMNSICPSDITCVIYKDDIDGFMSAFLMHHYNKTHNNDMIFYRAEKEEKNPPWDLIIGKTSLICGYTYGSEHITNIINLANHILIIDNNDICVDSGFDDYKIIDKNHSICYLTWKNLIKEKMPLVISCMDRVKFANADKIIAYIKSLPQDFDNYKKLLDDSNFDNICNEGEIILDIHKKLVGDIMKNMSLKIAYLDNKYFIVGYVNSVILKDEISNKIFASYPFADCSVIYHNNKIEKMKIIINTNNCSSMDNYSNKSIFDNAIVNANEIHDALRTICYTYIGMMPMICVKSDNNRFILARYLLQYRNNNIQQCSYIYEIVHKQIIDKIYISAVMSENKNAHTINYVICIDNSIGEIMILQLFKLFSVGTIFVHIESAGEYSIINATYKN